MVKISQFPTLRAICLPSQGLNQSFTAFKEFGVSPAYFEEEGGFCADGGILSGMIRIYPRLGSFFWQLAPWRNGSASDSRSEGWEFESLWGHFSFIFEFIYFLKSLPHLGCTAQRFHVNIHCSQPHLEFLAHVVDLATIAAMLPDT